jgi:hypothetical protein
MPIGPDIQGAPTDALTPRAQWRTPGGDIARTLIEGRVWLVITDFPVLPILSQTLSSDAPTPRLLQVQTASQPGHVCPRRRSIDFPRLEPRWISVVCSDLVRWA